MLKEIKKNEHIIEIQYSRSTELWYAELLGSDTFVQCGSGETPEIALAELMSKIERLEHN